MNKYLLLAFSLATAAAVQHAEAQSYSAPINGNRQEVPQRQGAPVYRGEKAVGGFVRGAKGGNPLQIINPRAPQKYRGAPMDTVTFDDTSSSPQRNRGESPNRFVGVVLFGIRW